MRRLGSGSCWRRRDQERRPETKIPQEKVRITQAARADLEQVWEYTAENWGSEQADLYIDRLMLRFAWLTANTGLWHARPDNDEAVCSSAETSHVIFFCGKNDAICILRVLHGDMDSAGRVG